MKKKKWRYSRRRLKRLLLRMFYRRLWTKLAIALLVIITIPVILLGILLVNNSQQALKNSVLNNHKQIVTRAAEEIGLFVSRPEDILKACAAMMGRVNITAWEQETILVELVLNQSIFIRAFSVDPSGKVIASSELGKKTAPQYPEQALVAVQAGNPYISEVKFLDNNTPYLNIAVPIKKMGGVRKALIADVNLRKMWEIIDGIKLNKTGWAFLVAGDGVVIAHQDKQQVLKNKTYKNHKDVQAVLSGQTNAIELKDEFGQNWVSSYTPVPNTGWGIILRQKTDEAYLFSNVMKVQSWIMIILAELAAILASIFLARMLVKPLKALVFRFKSTANGELGQNIGTRRKDEIGDLIRSFNRMTEELKRAKSREHFSTIGESVTRVAHELKNSLVPIKSFVYLFPRKYGDEKFVDKFSRLMPDEINRWERMIKDLSEFSTGTELEKAETDIRQLMQSTLEIMEEGFSQKQVKVICEVGYGNFLAMADPERLKQVFMNLILNALNAMSEGGLLEVSMDTMSYGAEGEYIEIRIKDTGKGIPKDELKKIFKPFHTKTKGGMGLGLSITRKIVKEHGGAIDVTSEVDQGTTFTIKLPKCIKSSVVKKG
ncbi:MAG: sensor histidine kinase [PVC group bacterium]|nr:sensor histidine kinase [PVC group bacterium]